MTAQKEPDQSPELTSTTNYQLDAAPQRVTRRNLIGRLAASTGSILLGGCAGLGAKNEIAPTQVAVVLPTLVVTPATLTPTPRAKTPVAATTSATAAPASHTPLPSKTPMLATLTPLAATATPTVGSRIFLPQASAATLIATRPAYPVPALATPNASQPYPSPSDTPAPTQLPTPTPRPTATPTPICVTPGDAPLETSPPLIGLHASADPAISAEERCMFRDLRPSLIKVLTFHPPPDISQLKQSQPLSDWIVRTFLSFGGRDLSPEDFVRFTLSDTQRTVRLLQGSGVVVELHNEPNLVPEGLGTSWADGSAFATWWLDVLQRYREQLPNQRFIYPGLSPGSAIEGLRQSHIEFIEQSRSAVSAADGLGVHLYWSAVSPMQDAIDTLDDYIARFPNKPIWITEASYNKGGIDEEQRAREYLTFSKALEERPSVQGVTFFVASASDPTFAEEAWLGTGLARRIGQRDPR